MDTPTQAPYEIAEYLPPYARAHAARQHYRGTRNEDGECPLGAALRRAALSTLKDPCAHQVARAISGSGSLDHRARGAAWRFISDWEAGEIADLAAALGVADER